MTALNDEQIEAILAGQADEPADLDEATARRIAEKRALRRRLHDALEAIQPPTGLADRVRAAMVMADAPTAAPAEAAPTETRRHGRVRWMGPLAGLAAAAMLVLGIVLFGGTGPQPAAAQPAFHQIHEANLAGQNAFQPAESPRAIMARWRQEANTDVSLPDLPEHCRYVGSALAKFRDQTVGSVVIDVDGKPISVIAIRQSPESLGFRHQFDRDGQHWCACAYQDCRMASVRVGDETLVAIGEVDQQSLVDLLARFVDAKKKD